MSRPPKQERQLRRRHLTIQSTGRPKGRRLLQTLGVVNTFVSEPALCLCFAAVKVIAAQMTTGAKSKPKARTGKVVVLRVTLRNNKSSARAKARARTNVAQSMGPQPLRLSSFASTRKASVALPRGLRLKSGMPPFPALTATPNHSIERTRSGRPLQAIISFLAFRSLPPLAAHVKR